jgi:hypothetical protein
MVELVADIPLTAVGYSIVSPTTRRPRKYRKICAAGGLDPTDKGWGFLRCLDVNGERLTLVTEDIDYMELLISGRRVGALDQLEVSVDTFPVVRQGWPDDW